jgi:FkbM family methyltransferase
MTLMLKRFVPEVIKAPLRKFHRLTLPSLRYNTLYRKYYNPHRELSIDEQQIIHDFGYTRAIMRWMRDRGDATLRVNYPLRPDSIVFDVGGYSGDWCAAIVRRYDPHVHVFEPIAEFADHVAKRFANNRKVHVHRFGLSDCDGTLTMGIAGPGSSSFQTGGALEQVAMRDIASFVSEQEITQIDLIKINIEGGEYSLLPRMIETGLVKKCQHIQIQFHEWVPGSHRARRQIRKQLRTSHELSYDYPFVWEGWKSLMAYELK